MKNLILGVSYFLLHCFIIFPIYYAYPSYFDTPNKLIYYYIPLSLLCFLLTLGIGKLYDKKFK